MKFYPQNNYILCKQIVEQFADFEVNGFRYKKENFPLYQIVDIQDHELFSDYSVGDVIAINSIPTTVSDSNEKYYLVAFDNIAAKIID